VDCGIITRVRTKDEIRDDTHHRFLLTSKVANTCIDYTVAHFLPTDISGGTDLKLGRGPRGGGRLVALLDFPQGPSLP